jgi:hypothetical protein
MNMNDKYALAEKIIELKRSLLQLSIQHWLNYELFTWQWWAKFIYMIVPIIIWYKLLDRKRISEIVSYGLLVSLILTILDVIGFNFVLWEYPIRSLPIGFFIINDVVFLPIVYMLFFQYYSEWKSFIVANIFLSIVGSFIVEPLYILMGTYKELTWRHTYSFFLYVFVAIFCKCIINKINYIYIKNQT